MERIAVLIHKFAPNPSTYLLGLLMAEWQKTGFDVQVIRGVEIFLPADLLIPHLDLTVVPDEYRTFMQRYPRVINQSVVDISKTKISSNLLAKGDAYRGPVIVKTDRNFGGVPEARLEAGTHRHRGSFSGLFGRMAAKIGKTVTGATPWRYVNELKTIEYPVFPSLADVPRGVFGNRNLIVEKFCPELEDGHYAVRYYWFCGDREISYRLVSTQPIIKVANAFRLEEVAVPAELRSMRQQLGFDFGKFDYAVHGGKVMLFDANRTPGGSFVKHTHCQPLHTIAHHLADGIRSLLGEREAIDVAEATPLNGNIFSNTQPLAS